MPRKYKSYELYRFLRVTGPDLYGIVQRVPVRGVQPPHELQRSERGLIVEIGGTDFPAQTLRQLTEYVVNLSTSVKINYIVIRVRISVFITSVKRTDLFVGLWFSVGSS